MKKLILPAMALVLLTTSSASAGPMIVAAGDIAPRKNPRVSVRTAALIEQIDPVKVLTLGDNQYTNGTYKEFLGSYDKSWGAFKSITAPTPGEHDYRTLGAAGYKQYFGDLATPRGRTYYAYKIDHWGLIALDSNIPRGPDSEQVQWLFDEVVRWDDRECVLAYWHHPRFSSGEVHGSYPSVSEFWRWLDVGGVDIALNGHEHSYERFRRQRAFGGRPGQLGGVREFVVGTGGRSLTGFQDEPAKRSEVRIEGRYGVLAIELRRLSYRWEFIATDGEVLDFGAERCDRPR